jgi:hypothetical protein
MRSLKHEKKQLIASLTSEPKTLVHEQQRGREARITYLVDHRLLDTGVHHIAVLGK